MQEGAGFAVQGEEDLVEHMVGELVGRIGLGI